MTIDEILQLPDFKKAVDILTKDSKEDRNREDYVKEYKGERTRRDKGVDRREDKLIDVYSETEVDENENPKKIGSKSIPVAKVKTNIPKRIVRIAAAFLFGGQMNINFADENDAASFFEEIFDKSLKMKSVLNKFARTVMSETKSALVFYPRPSEIDGEKRIDIKVKILTLANGDFWPHFDDYGDMDAFIRKYRAVHADGQERDFLWIQTATKEITYVDVSGEWVPVEGKTLTNLAGKITVVYAEQDDPEWEEIATAMDHYENRLSRMVDTNDYFGDPILKNYGESSLPSKNTVGKQISYPIKVDELTGKEYHGDADYLVWQQSIDSIKLELETLRNEIYSGSSTPDLSFENMKSIGALSGTAIELMFIETYIKAAEKMEIFGPVVQRCVSVVKALISNVTDTKYKEGLKKAKPEVTFDSILPDDLKEKIEMLVSANGGKAINSQETIVSNSPFTKNQMEELARLKKEADEESERSVATGFSLQ
ncbi:phage portal protein, SPP1 family [Porphyromonadaceae bacterium KH3CP3RA]|nr:phage portal protein, SPP1 family [Porphyromonadaceae bacterium KH3CP3RA]